MNQTDLLMNLCVFLLAETAFPFYRYHNQQPTGSNQSEFQSFPVTSHPECFEKCDQKARYKERCQGFMFERYTKSCTIFMAQLTGPFEKAEGKDLYVSVGGRYGKFPFPFSISPRGDIKIHCLVTM